MSLLNTAYSAPLRILRADPLLLLLCCALLVLSLITPTHLARYPTLVDWHTIAAMTGLLLLTKAIEISGVLHRLGIRLTRTIGSERSLALLLVFGTATLAAALTNDVALFVVVPLTLSICRTAQLPATRLIVFEALAANAGSLLTPIGNPQNLFLWQRAGIGFFEFTVNMIPLALIVLGLLGIFTVFAFPNHGIVASTAVAVRVKKTLLAAALLIYPIFLALTDLHVAQIGLAPVVVLFLLIEPEVLRRLDWGLLLVFILMFVDLRLLTALPEMAKFVADAGIADAQRLYVFGIGASQLISNVPAAILLAEYSDNWRTIAWAVNIGGFGLATGSLANLIALRLAGDRRAWLAFHALSIPFLVASCLLAYLFLVWIQ